MSSAGGPHAGLDETDQAASADVDVEVDIRELLRQRYYIGVEAASIAAIAVVAAVVVLLWGQVPRPNLLGWATAMMVAIPLPPALKHLKLDIDTWRYLVYPVEFLHGVLWGSLAAFVLPVDPVYQGVVGAVATCVLLGGSISSSQFLPAFASFTAPLVALFIYGFATQGAPGTVNLIWLMLVAWAYGASVAVDQRQLHLNLIDTVKHNETLVAELETERARMVVANDRLASAAATAKRMARTDPLTGLANRLRFEEFLSESLRELSHGDVSVVNLAYLDLDDFKAVNDRGGHRAGDQLLTSVAQRLIAAVAEYEMVARIGGDELVVVSTVGDAADLGRRVRAIFDTPIAIGPETIPVAASIGVAGTNVAVDDDELIRRADTAQYEAKRAGGARVVVARPPTSRAAIPVPTPTGPRVA